MPLLKSPKFVIGLCLSGVFGILAIIGPLLAPDNPGASVSTTNSTPMPPSAAHWLGTTQVQQDVFSQLLVGGRSTILVSVVAGAVATVLAVLFGVTAGYFGGSADDLLSMLANIFLVLPALPLLIVIFGFLGKGANPNDAVIGVIIAVTGWAFGARQLRAQTLSMRTRDFVDAARIIGERSWRIMTFEILPNLIPVVATSFLFTVIYGVGTYTALSFLGVISTSHWSWGTMLYWAQSAQAAQQVHLECGGSCHRGWPWACSARARAAQLRDRRVRQPAAAGAASAASRPPRAPGRAAAPACAGPDARAADLAEGVMNGGTRPVYSGARQGSHQVESRPGIGSGVGAHEVLVEVRGLCVDYGLGDGAVHAVLDADLELRRGEVLGLAGRAAAASPPWPTRSPGCCGRRASSPRARPAFGGPSTCSPRVAHCAATLERLAVVMQSAMNALNPVLTIGTQAADVPGPTDRARVPAGGQGTGARPAGAGRHRPRAGPAPLPARAVRRHAAAPASSPSRWRWSPTWW